LSLVIVGSIGLDSVSTPQEDVNEVLGGSAVYGAVAGSHFCPTYIVGVVGTDFPMDSLKMLQDNGVNLDGLVYKEGKTFRWIGKYNTWNRAETLRTDLNVFADFSPELPESCKCCKSLLLANIHPGLQLQVLNQISSYSHLACDTMNYWISLCPDELIQVLRRVDIVFMNEDEVRDWSGRRDIYSAARDVLALGPQWVIVKRGEYGSVAISSEYKFFAPAYPVEKVCDPTGAGDSFAGAFMAYLANFNLLKPALIKEAVRYGTILAALNVQDFSVRSISAIARAEIDLLKDNLVKWTS